MIIIPIPVSGTPLGGFGPGAVKLPKMSRVDFPDLKPGDAVGIIRHEGGFPVAWCAYLYVVPTDEEAYWLLPGGERIERYWGFESCRHASTRWGARRALRKMVYQYVEGIRREVQEIRL